MSITQIQGSQILDNTITASDLASGSVVPSKISAVATDDFSFPRDITAGRDLYLDTDNTLFLGDSNNALIRYSSNHSSLFMQSNASNQLDLAVAEKLTLYSHTGTDGNGSWYPSIELNDNGAVVIENDGTEGSDTNRKLHITFNNGLIVGENPVVEFNRTAGNHFLTIGYVSDGVGDTESYIRSRAGHPLRIGTETTPTALQILDGGDVGIGGAPVTNGILTINSTTKAFVPPRMTTTQRDAITPLTAGMTIFNTDDNELNVYNGTMWVPVGSTAFPLLAPDGTVSAPSYSFENQTNTGLFLSGLQLSVASNGTEVVRFGDAGIEVQVDIPLKNSAGNETSPSYTFVDDESAGLFLDTNDLVFVTGSTSALKIASDQTIDFLQHEAKQLVVHILASDPGSPVEGQIWYNTTTKQWVGYNGVINVVLG